MFQLVCAWWWFVPCLFCLGSKLASRSWASCCDPVAILSSELWGAWSFQYDMQEQMLMNVYIDYGYGALFADNGWDFWLVEGQQSVRATVRSYPLMLVFSCFFVLGCLGECAELFISFWGEEVDFKYGIQGLTLSNAVWPMPTLQNGNYDWNEGLSCVNLKWIMNLNHQPRIRIRIRILHT